jgi:hypothetical protein
LPSHPQAEFPVTAEFLSPFEECLMQVQRILVGWPRRVQLPTDQTALEFSVNAEPLAEVKISAKEITLKEVAVDCGGNISDATNPKSLRSESDFPAQCEKSIFRAQRDVFERIPEVYLLAAIFEEAPIFLCRVCQIDTLCGRLPKGNRASRTKERQCRKEFYN